MEAVRVLDKSLGRLQSKQRVPLAPGPCSVSVWGQEREAVRLCGEAGIVRSHGGIGDCGFLCLGALKTQGWPSTRDTKPLSGNSCSLHTCGEEHWVLDQAAEGPCVWLLTACLCPHPVRCRPVWVLIQKLSEPRGGCRAGAGNGRVTGLTLSSELLSTVLISGWLWHSPLLFLLWPSRQSLSFLPPLKGTCWDSTWSQWSV